MGTYAVTGSASGMGAAVVARLRKAGHTVLTVDREEADVVADLSTVDGRLRAATSVLDRCGGTLDGAVMAAGIGPASGRDRARLIAQVNYCGVVELLEAWRPALAAADRAKVVASPATPRRRSRPCRSGRSARCSRAIRIGRQGRCVATGVRLRR